MAEQADTPRAGQPLSSRARPRSCSGANAPASRRRESANRVVRVRYAELAQGPITGSHSNRSDHDAGIVVGRVRDAARIPGSIGVPAGPAVCTCRLLGARPSSGPARAPLYGALSLTGKQEIKHPCGVPEWRDPDSNRGHHDFQSCALPAELSRRGRSMLAPGGRTGSGKAGPRNDCCERRTAGNKSRGEQAALRSAPREVELGRP
jgi:hypothetical protein